MNVLPTCPSCGMPSNEPRCPRCNTLKVVGCSGSCSMCGSGESCKTPIPAGTRPSDNAREDLDHPGTPLER